LDRRSSNGTSENGKIVREKGIRGEEKTPWRRRRGSAVEIGNPPYVKWRKNKKWGRKKKRENQGENLDKPLL